MAKAIVNHPRVANGGTSAQKPKSAIGGARAYPNTPQGLVKPKGFDKEWSVFQKSKPANAAIAPISAGPAAPQTNAQPFNAAYELTAAGAEKQLADTQANLGYKKTATEQEYGLEGPYSDFATNPYSRAALLEQSYQRANRGTQNASAASGQLYAGSNQNAQGYNRDSRDLEHNNLSSAYGKALATIREEGTAAENLSREKIAEAGWKRLEASERAALEPEEFSGGGGEGGGGGGTPNPYTEQAGGVTKKAKVKTKSGKTTTTKIGVSGAKKAR